MRRHTRAAEEQDRERHHFHRYKYSSHTTTEVEQEAVLDLLLTAASTTIPPIDPSLITPSDPTPLHDQQLIGFSEHPLLTSSFSPTQLDVSLPPLFLEGGILAENGLLSPSDFSTQR